MAGEYIMIFSCFCTMNKPIFLQMCQKFVVKVSFRIWINFLKVLNGKMSVGSRSLFDRRQTESLLHLLVIHNGFHFKNSSLRNWNILRDTRNALWGINYVLPDNKYVLLDTKHVLGDTNNVLHQDTTYVLRDTKNIPQDI